MYNLNLQYQNLLKDILNKGEKDDKSTSLLGTQIFYNLEEGFPILNTKTSLLQQIITELKWSLKGNTNIKYLIDNNCNTWNNIAYEYYINNYNKLKLNFKHIENIDNYLYKSIFKDKLLSKEEYIQSIKSNEIINEDFNFSDLWGNLGPIYTKQLKSQIKKLLEWVKSPQTLDYVVNLYNFDDIFYAAIKPSYISFQCYISNNKLNLVWNQNKSNIITELPNNILFYSLLLSLLCEEGNFKPGNLIGSFGKVYFENKEMQKLKTNFNKQIFNFSKIKLDNVNIKEGEFDFTLI
jgi:thymidylate synthase|tara:strand:- start:126 stop:1004 length:879 start_codon:yes stop_codon:yes gene_type:complete